MLIPLGSMAQQRNKQVTIEVTSLEGDNLAGQPLTLTHTGYNVGYGALKLDAQGRCALKVYPGDHLLEMSRSGFEPVSHAFTVGEDDEPQTVKVTLAEKTRTPFGLATEVEHNPFTGANNVIFSWNNETPAFFDDFESYPAFAIEFSPWTGIDVDRETTASFVGSYPNRGTLQYAQIMSPLDVEPTWWYEMPTLRPSSGRQYVGFLRTETGRANDDWLISPAIEVGVENVLSFLAKAADIYKEKFMVYVTTKVDNPGTEDFIRIDKATFESTSNYASWDRFTYDLADYAGQTIKFAIRYIGNPQTTGALMLMVDDVYVGSANGLKRMEAPKKTAPRARRSPDNPYETFEVYLDGEKVETVDGYSVCLNDVATGTHTLGVRACYTNTQSPITETELVIPADGYAKVTFNVTSNSVLPSSAAQFELLFKESSSVLNLTAADDKITLNSLPLGEYQLGVAEGAFSEIIKNLDIKGDTVIAVELTDNIITPYNITADTDESGATLLRWNRDLGFTDSFEDYRDFATGSFGEWLSIDGDGMPVYPISLNGSLIAFPGSGNATNPQPSAPMVFNPWKTEPPMLPTDPAIAAPTGDKTVIFFSSQRAVANKWLITPPLTIRSGFRFSMKAKGYTNQYPESMEICISTSGSTNPADFEVLAEIPELASENWMQYSVDLAQYVDQEVRMAVHYTSRDAFLAQVDDVAVGPDEKEAESVDYGNVIRYEIYVDGEKVGETTEPEFTIPALGPGEHTIEIVAVYRNGNSEPGVYTLTTSGLQRIEIDATAPSEYFDLMGRRLSAPATGITLLRRGNNVTKLIR